MKSIMFLMAFLVTALPFSPQSHADEMAKDKMMKDIQKPAAVVFFSENCGSCKILDPRMKEAMSQIKENAVDVVVFDFSNKDKIAMTKAMAEEKGLNDVLNKFGARTGFVALVDKDGNIVDKINVSHDVEDIKTKINALI